MLKEIFKYKKYIISGVFFVSFVIPLHVNANESCSLMLNQPNVDLGKSQRSTLIDNRDADGLVRLKTRAITLNVFCNDPSTISLSFIGQQLSFDSFRFASYGGFKLKIVSLVVDGVSANLVSHGNSGKIESYFKPNDNLTPSLNGNAIKGKSFTAQVEVYTYVTLADADARTMKTWRGSGYFTVSANKGDI